MNGTVKFKGVEAKSPVFNLFINNMQITNLSQSKSVWQTIQFFFRYKYVSLYSSEFSLSMKDYYSIK